MKDLLDSNSNVENVLDEKKVNYSFNINDKLKILINDKDENFNEEEIKKWAKRNNATELFLNLWNIYYLQLT